MISSAAQQKEGKLKQEISRHRLQIYNELAILIIPITNEDLIRMRNIMDCIRTARFLSVQMM